MVKLDKPKYSVDIVIFGAGIAGLWTFHRLKKLGYDVVLFEQSSIGCGQTIAAQGILHSGLKFSLAGKVNTLAQSISKMPERWKDAMAGTGDVDLGAATVNTASQQLLIPSGFLGGITKIITQRMLGDQVREVPQAEWPKDLKNSGFKGSAIYMDEPVVDVPSVLRALADPYSDYIKKITKENAAQPFEFLQNHGITAKRVIFTAAKSNQEIALKNNDNVGLETQKRPLVQAMMKNAPFPLFAHLVGKTDKPIASITTHETESGELVWYLGGGVAERTMDTNPDNVYQDALTALKTYLPAINFEKAEWAALPIERIEGKSKTDSWMPDTPTIHKTGDVLYCWPTKMTFAPMLSDMIMDDLKSHNIKPSGQSTQINSFSRAEFTQTPWDKAKWKKLN